MQVSPFWVFVLVAGLSAQENQYDAKPIRAIEYEPAAQPLTAGQLESFQPLKLGQPLTKDAVTAAIDKLFSSGRYADIQVDVSQRGDGVAVRFITTSQQFIGHITVEGKISNPPSAGLIEDTAQLQLGHPFDPKQVDESDTAIRDLFQRNGLYKATVTHRFVPVAEGQQMSIVFEVTSGERARYSEPAITGDPKLPDMEIAKATGWRRFLVGGWKTVTESRTRGGVQGIEKRLQKKKRLSAKVELKSMDYDATTHQVKPAIDIQAGPQVNLEAIDAKVSQRVLRKFVPVFEEQTVDRDLLVEGARNLRDYLQAQGYYEAQIDFHEVPDPDKGQLNIRYVIEKGSRYRLAHIGVTGNKYFDRAAITERLLVRTASFPAFRHGRYSEAYVERDQQNIENLYKSNGFRDVKVTAATQKDYLAKTGDIAVTYSIEEGPQWRIDKLTVGGWSDDAMKAVQPRLTSSAGQPFSEFNVAADRREILNYYFSQGYPSPEFSWKFEETGPPHTVNVQYDISSGQQRFVRQVIVTGLETTRRKLVDDALAIKEGDPLSPTAITATQRALYDRGVFAKVSPAIQNPDGAEREKILLFDLDEASRYTLRLGVGADVSRFGPSTMDLSQPDNATGFSPRFSGELSRLNFLGIGHTVSVQGRVSTLEQRVLLNYFAPRFLNADGRNITFSLLYDDSRDVRTFTSRREEGSVQISQKFTKAVNGLFQFSYRRVGTSNIAIPTLLVPQLAQPVRIGLFSASLIQDRRDSPTNPTHGIYNTIDVGVASNIFGSQRSFVRALGRNATYYRIGKNLVLARELTFGIISPFRVPPGTSNAGDIPLPERFFGGGGQSMRGFPENQAGPRDTGMPAEPGGTASEPTGFPLGGNALFFHDTELRFPLIGENVGGVFFHDMGNIFDTIGDLSFRFHQKNNQDFNYMVHAVGFGLRYKTPVGPVRVDLAYSINPPSFVGFKGTYQQLLLCNPNTPTTNPSYCTGVPQGINHFQFFFSIGQTF
ncbi:MAG TPA: POTRA domain-containing protein [Bryobacteraceae bacterium]|nr:POTRA domain-containing protein [Bryobacteraceae bacterium]